MLISLLSALVMSYLFRFFALAILILLLFATTTFRAYALSYLPMLTPTRPVIYDANGDRLVYVETGKQVTIMTTLLSNSQADINFVGIIEIRDPHGVTVFLAWQSGTIGLDGNKTIGASWVVPQLSDYQSRIFAITGFENPHVLSNVVTSNIYEARPR
jgi:hypothetical protein